MKGLAPYSLTKAEKLQLVNLAPTLPVELYVVRSGHDHREVMNDEVDVI